MSLLKLFPKISFIAARELGRAAFRLRKGQINNEVLPLLTHFAGVTLFK